MLTIGIPVYNALDYLKITIDGVRKNTINKYEIIIVDDCSDEETKNYLKELKDVKLITNTEINGFPKNCNTIIKNASFDKICLLNSDVYCPYGWDVKLLSALNAYDICGPSSCHVYGKQLLEDAKTHRFDWGFDEIEKYAISVSNKYKGDIAEIKTVSGFCFCINKSVIDKIGYFDEIFTRGSFEETDLCYRAREKGLKCVWVKGCYLHHYGHISFSTVKDAEQLWENNKQLFTKKHNLKNLNCIEDK
jgi:GT2 family glycosyltransferase